MVAKHMLVEYSKNVVIYVVVSIEMLFCIVSGWLL